MIKELICVCCPNGCRLAVDEDRDYTVSGNLCPRGIEYGRSEVLNPMRVVTSSVHISGAAINKCPVRTDRAVPRDSVMDIADLIKGTHISAPVHIGDVVIENAAGTGARVIATKNVELK